MGNFAKKAAKMKIFKPPNKEGPQTFGLDIIDKPL
jgi:hypothetical protein